MGEEELWLISRSMSTRFRWIQETKFQPEDSWAITYVYIGDECDCSCGGHGRCDRGKCLLVALTLTSTLKMNKVKYKLNDTTTTTKTLLFIIELNAIQYSCNWVLLCMQFWTFYAQHTKFRIAYWSRAFTGTGRVEEVSFEFRIHLFCLEFNNNNIIRINIKVSISINFTTNIRH